MIFDEKSVADIVKEVRIEQSISPKIPDDNFTNYVKEGMYNINDSVGYMIKYDEDLEARVLLKNYVLYANHKRLAEFKELYIADYVKLQIKYNIDTSI